MQAILVTPDHVFSGQIENHDHRLLDELLDTNSRYLELREASVFVPSRKERIAFAEEAVVIKEKMALALITSHKHEAALLRQHARVERTIKDVFLAVGAYAVCGKLHVPKINELRRLLAAALGSFFPVPDAVVMTPFDTVLQVPVAIVNHRFVSYMQFISEDSPALHTAMARAGSPAAAGQQHPFQTAVAEPATSSLVADGAPAS